FRYRYRAVRSEPSRFLPVPGPPRSGPRLRLPAARRLRRTTRTLCLRRRTPKICWHCACDRTERQEVLGTLASPVSKVPPANVCRMGGGVDPAFFLGAAVLPAATRQGQSPSGRGTGTGIQMDPHPVSVLAGAHAVR